jgi:hypothetical protein
LILNSVPLKKRTALFHLMLADKSDDYGLLFSRCELAKSPIEARDFSCSDKRFECIWQRRVWNVVLTFGKFHAVCGTVRVLVESDRECPSTAESMIDLLQWLIWAALTFTWQAINSANSRSKNTASATYNFVTTLAVSGCYLMSIILVGNILIASRSRGRDFVRHVFESWVLAQHVYWSVGRGLADARAQGKTLLRLRVILNEGGWTLAPGASRGSAPRPTPDRLQTMVSLALECGLFKCLRA